VSTGKEIARLDHDGYLSSITFSRDGLTLATASGDTARLWRVYPTAQSLVDAAKARAASCLTEAQRKQYFLPAAPPLWCVGRRLWPYRGDAWQAWAWIAANRQGEAPLPLPLPLPLPKAE